MKQNFSNPVNASRRNFLKSGTLLAALVPAQSAISLVPGERQQTLVVLSPEWAYLADSEFLPDQGRFQALVLKTDLVRLWRDSLEQEIILNNKTVVGLTNWADFITLRGLAQESSLLMKSEAGIHSGHERIMAPDSVGNSTSTQLINWTLSL